MTRFTLARTIIRTKFAGYYRDMPGQDYAMARYYSATSGSFWSPDPGGMKTATHGDPTGWNRYAYVGGDPINFRDPGGRERCDADTCVNVYADDWCKDNPYDASCPGGGSGGGGGGNGGGGSGGGGGNLSPQQVAYGFAQADQQLVKQGRLTDCQALAAFAGTMALMFGDNDVSGFTQTFSVLIPEVPGESAMGVGWNSDPITLGITGTSGFQTQLQNGYGTAAGPNGDDQAHHFAFFFEAGYYNLTAATAAAYGLEYAQSPFDVNQGDINLGLSASALGGLLSSHAIKPSDVQGLILKGLCQH